MADTQTSSSDPKTTAVQAFVAGLKSLGIEIAEDLTSPDTEAKINAALTVLWPKANAIVEAFSPGWLGMVEKVALPWAEGKATGLIDHVIENVHAHLASSTVAVVPKAEANVLAGAVPALHPVHVAGAEQAKVDALSPAEKDAYVHAHQPVPSSAES